MTQDTAATTHLMLSSPNDTGGPSLVMTSHGTYALAISARSDKRVKSSYHLPSQHRHRYSPKCTWIQCTSHPPADSPTSFKAVACSHITQSLECSERKPLNQSVTGSFRTSFVAGGPSLKLSPITANHS